MTIPDTNKNPAAIADMHGQKDFIEKMNPKFFVGNHKRSEYVCDTDVAHAYLRPILPFNKEV